MYACRICGGGIHKGGHKKCPFAALPTRDSLFRDAELHELSKHGVKLQFQWARWARFDLLHRWSKVSKVSGNSTKHHMVAFYEGGIDGIDSLSDTDVLEVLHTFRIGPIRNVTEGKKLLKMRLSTSGVIETALGDLPSNYPIRCSEEKKNKFIHVFDIPDGEFTQRLGSKCGFEGCDGFIETRNFR